MKDSWDKITLKDYEHIRNIQNDINLSNTEKEIKLISALFEIDEEEAWQMNAMEVLEKLSKIQFLSEFKINENFGEHVLKTNPNSTKKEIKVGDREYEVEIDINNIPYSQYVQFQTTDMKDMKTILGIILIPKGKTFGKDYNMTEHAEYIYNNISFQMSQDILFFVVRHFLNSINGLVMSLDKKEQKELKKMMEEMQRKTKE